MEVNVGGTGRPLIGKLQLPAGAEREVDDWNSSPIVLQRTSVAGNGLTADVSQYPFAINGDGSFRVEDLPAGDYRLTVIAVDLQATDSDLEIGRVEREFTIQEIPGGRSDEPLDLGTLELKLK